MEEKKEKKEKKVKSEVLDHKCLNCGAKLGFDPESGNWKCKYCDSTFELKDLENKNNAGNKEKNKSVDDDKVDDYDDYISYKCPDCGAEIITDEQTTATFCVYCGNTAILRNKLSGKFMPSRVIPFKKTKEDAIKAFKSLSKGRPLVPDDFTDQKNIEKIRGIYIPFWFHTFKIEGEVDFTGNKYEHWTTGNTKVYEMKREGSIDFESVPIDGSTRFPNDLMNTIQPYNYDELKKYNHAYLSGFLAERFDVEGETTRKDLEPDVLNSAKQIFMGSATGYSSLTTKKNTLHTKDYNLEYVLLPVYMVNVKYNDKMHTFAMNGQTGKFIGNIPVDKKKKRAISIKKFIIYFIVYLIISFILYLVGGNQ